MAWDQDRGITGASMSTRGSATRANDAGRSAAKNPNSGNANEKSETLMTLLARVTSRARLARQCRSARVILLVATALIVLAAPVTAQERLGHELGEFEFLPTSTGVLITAPHGTYDANTAPLAVEVARRLGAGYVVARRFTVDQTRINVNRPTEGAGLACAREPHTARAKEVYGLYAQVVSTTSVGRPLRLYVEIHGNSDSRTSQRIEIATTGISRDQARSVKDAYPAILVRAREQVPVYPELALLVEPLDQVVFNASCAKSVGIFATDLVPRVVHFEFPRSVRERESREATALLIAEIVRVLMAER